MKPTEVKGELEMTSASKTEIEISWTFDTSGIHSIVSIDPPDINPKFTDPGVTAIALMGLEPGTTYSVAIFPAVGNFSDHSSNLGDPLVAEITTSPETPLIDVLEATGDSLSGIVEIQGRFTLIEILLLESFHEPSICSLAHETCSWKFEDLLPGNSYTLYVLVSTKDSKTNSTFEVSTLPKPPYPIDQTVDDSDYSTKILLDIQMMTSQFILKVICPPLEESFGPYKFSTRFLFEATSSMFGCKMRTKSFSKGISGNWFEFAIGISVITHLTAGMIFSRL